MCRPVCGIGSVAGLLNIEGLLNEREDLSFSEKIIGLICMRISAPGFVDSHDAKYCKACMSLPWNKLSSPEMTEKYLKRIPNFPFDKGNDEAMSDFSSALATLMRNYGVSGKNACEALNLCPQSFYHCDAPDIPIFASYDSCATCTQLDPKDLNVLKQTAVSKEHMESLLDTLCMDSHCRTFMHDHAASLAAILMMHDADLSKVCSKLNICPTHETDHCLVCHLMTNQLDNMISHHDPSSPISTDFIKETLPKACAAILPRFFPQCKDFLFHYEPAIVSALTGSIQLPAKKICPKLGICKSRPNVDESLTTVVCPLCVALIESIEQALLRNATREQMLTVGITICKKFSPTSKEKICEQFVRNHIDQMIELAEKVEASTACQLISLCKAPSFGRPHVPTGQYNLTYCSMCQLLVMSGRAFAEQTHVIEKLTEILKNNACKQFEDEDLRRDCADLMDAISRVLSFVMDKADSLTVCTSIFDACPITPPRSGTVNNWEKLIA
ncbi:hypothetical protein ACOME3_009122 [Neoechinorhynchus agilis]